MPCSCINPSSVELVKQNYFREETLIRANAKLVDYQTTLSLAKKWGGGEVASADGMRFVAPIRTITQDQTVNTLVPTGGSLGTTLFRISILDSMVL